MRKLIITVFTLITLFTGTIFTGICLADTALTTKDNFHESPALERAIDQMQNYVFFTVGSEQSETVTANTGYLKFRMPYAFELVGVRANLYEAPSADMIIDVNDGDGNTIFNSYVNAVGSTIPATKLYVQSGSETSLDTYLATSPSGSEYYMTTTSFTDNESITVDVDSTTGGVGLNVTFYGRIRSIPSNY